MGNETEVLNLGHKKKIETGTRRVGDSRMSTIRLRG